MFQGRRGITDFVLSVMKQITQVKLLTATNLLVTFTSNLPVQLTLFNLTLLQLEQVFRLKKS
jgi:hypothetical protein